MLFLFGDSPRAVKFVFFLGLTLACNLHAQEKGDANEVEANATLPKLELIPVERSANALTPFEKAELRRLFGLDLRELARRPIKGVLGYEQEYWRNPASVHVIRPDDFSLNGHVLTVEALRGVPGMFVSRGVGYDDYVIMRNFSGSSTEKFLAMTDGREMLQHMGGTVNATVEGVPLEIIDRIEIVRGPGASIWGTNAVSGVYNIVTKSAAATQGDSVRLVIRDDGTFLGDYVHGGQAGEDAFYRVWFRDQEYAEGELLSGLPARDDGYFRKAGFRYDKMLSPNLDLTFSGAYGERRVEHILDLSHRLYYYNGVDASGQPDLIPIATAARAETLSPGSFPGAAVPSTWQPYLAFSNAGMPEGFVRYQYYGEMPVDAGHLRGKLTGITDTDMEWSLAAYAERYRTFLGHVGYYWEEDEYDLDFRADQPLGERHHLAFGVGYRRMEEMVDSRMTPPWAFPTIDTISGTLTPTSFVPSTDIAILDYGSNPTKFNRFTGFLQDSYEASDNLLLSVGMKVEESDLTDFGLQPGARASWMVNDSNVLWTAYSRAHRTSSLIERYAKVNYARLYVPAMGAWLNQSFPGNPDYEKEVTDAYELGWRTQPRDDLTFELSLYHYDTRDAIFSGPPKYEVNDVKTTGGEFTFDFAPVDSWQLKGGVSRTFSEKEGVESSDFPKTIANMSSHLRLRDDLTFSQNFYYTSTRVIPSSYNPISVPAHLRMDLGLVWRPDETWEIGLFGRDLLDPDHPETMYVDLDVEPGKIERSFLLSLTKRF